MHAWEILRITSLLAGYWQSRYYYLPRATYMLNNSGHARTGLSIYSSMDSGFGAFQEG